MAILSADATPGQVRRLIAAGAQNYLTKPIDVRELLAFLDTAALTPAMPAVGTSQEPAEDNPAT